MNNYGKISLRGFFGSEEPLAIHCKTKDQAVTLCNMLNNCGYTWATGESYLNVNWGAFYENTCYDNDGEFCSISWYERNGYKIIDFDEFYLYNTETVVM